MRCELSFFVGEPLLPQLEFAKYGHDAQGRSTIVSDGQSPHVMMMADCDTFGVTDLWKTYSAPADNSEAAAGRSRSRRRRTAAGSIRWRMRGLKTDSVKSPCCDLLLGES